MDRSSSRTPVSVASAADQLPTGSGGISPARTRKTGRKAKRKSPDGDGSILDRQLADGSTVYDVYWSYRDAETGAPRRGSKRGFTSQDAAVRFRRDVTYSVAHRTYLPRPTDTVQTYLDGWLDTLRLKRQTVSGYRTKVRLHVLPYLGTMPLADVTPAHLNRLYRELEASGSHASCCRGRGSCGIRGSGPLGLATVRHVHNVLSAAYRDALEAGLLTEADISTRRAKPPTLRQVRSERAPFKTWSQQSCAAFLAAAEGHRLFALAAAAHHGDAPRRSTRPAS